VSFRLLPQIIEIHNRFPQPDRPPHQERGFSFTRPDGCIKITPGLMFYPRQTAISLKNIEKPFASGDINHKLLNRLSTFEISRFTP